MFMTQTLCAAIVAAAATTSAPPPIVVEETIGASIDEVWLAWTTSEGMSRALETPCTITLAPAGPFEILFVPDAPEGLRGSEGCKVLSWVDRSMLSFTWNAPPSFPGVRGGNRHTFVVVHLTPVDPVTTRVRLEHGGWPSEADAGALAEEWRGVHTYFTKAWPMFVGAMAKHLDGGVEPVDPDAAWVYLIRPTREDLIETMSPDEQATIGAHFEYLKRLTSEGVVVAGGPTMDKPPLGIVIFQSRDEPSARAIMEGDPAVRAGVFKAELHPMRLPLLRGRR